MHKQDHFPDQYRYVLPDYLLQDYRYSPILGELYVTDLGFYPDAKHHFIHRDQGTEEWILIICTGGRGTVKFDGHQYRMKSGSVCILPPNHEHEYYSSIKDPWDILWAHFRGSQATYYLPQSPSALYWDPEVPNSLLDNCNQIFHEMIGAYSSGFDFRHSFLVAQLLGLLLTKLSLNEQPIDKGFGENKYVSRSVQFIYDNLNRSISLRDVTNTVEVSPGYLNKLFNQYIGCSVNQFIAQIKVKQAMYYLHNTRIPVKQIAKRLGYNDPYYFSRTFKQHAKQTPSSYRHQRVPFGGF